jgi:hypothetical protein
MVSECKRAYNHQWYLANRERLLAESKARYEANPQAKYVSALERKYRLRLLMRQEKEGKSCVRCGFDDTRALDFHHRDANLKEISVSRMWHTGWSIERIRAEIAKCDILCANCHRVLHAEARGEE